ncbi:MAG: Beta-N-acetylglucosaminidase [Acidobacteria bacterium]|nr:Beta-N-acetylglucosaminidase [Acidobacteriota bacterium]
MPASLHHGIGQLALVGFDGLSITPEVASLARQFDLGGVILFKRNVESPEQVAEIAWRARALSRGLPPWVGVDQEGGRVARVRAPLTEWPPAETLGRAGSEALAERFGAALALELSVLGLSIDFAPVLDVLTNPANPVLVEHPPDRFRAVDFVPFRAAIAAGVAGVMTGHLLVPAFDGERPATLSRAIVQGLLREELGFGGLVFTDDMNMKAVAARYTPGRAAVAAIAAGCDALLLCGTDPAVQSEVLEELIHAVEREELPYTRVEEAIARQRDAKARFASLDPSPDPVTGDPVVPPLHRDWRPLRPEALRRVIGRDEHQAVADEMRGYL